LPNYEGIIRAYVQPVDETVYKESRAKLGLNGPATTIMPTDQVGAMFDKAVEVLGPSVKSYVSKNIGGWMARASSWASTLFGSHSVHKLMMLLHDDPGVLLPDLRRLVDKGMVPPELYECVYRLVQFRPIWNTKAIKFTTPDSVFISEYRETGDLFGSRKEWVSTRSHSTIELCQDDDSKSSFEIPSPVPSRRSTSKTRPPTNLR